MLSDERRAILLQQVAFYARLTPEERARFERQVAAFIERKVILTRGVELDDRVKVIVAAHACRLTLNMVAEEYSRLQYVHVVDSHHDDDGDRLLGSASANSSVTLEWRALVDGARDERDGENVGYHEFAHVLDASDGVSDGVPPLLLDPTQRRHWQRVVGDELEKLRGAVELGIPTVLDAGATKSEAELFAVATEAFFELPERLKNAHPELFMLLADFYRQRPDLAASD
jgi:MtfA peptidase